MSDTKRAGSPQTIWRIVRPYLPDRGTVIMAVAVFTMGLLWGTQNPRSLEQPLILFGLELVGTVAAFGVLYGISIIYWRRFLQPLVRQMTPDDHTHIQHVPPRSVSHSAGQRLPITGDTERRGGSPPIFRLQTTYTHTGGEGGFDESYPIHHEHADPLVDYGEVGVIAVNRPGYNDEVLALEVWLFDRSDLSRVQVGYFISDDLMHMPQTRARLEARGVLTRVVAETPLLLETRQLQLEAVIVDCAYLPHCNSFRSVRLEITIWQKRNHASR